MLLICFSKTKIYFDLIILTKTLAEISKVQPFSSKNARTKIFIPIWLNLPELRTQKPLTQSLYFPKGASPTFTYIECSGLNFCRFLLNFLGDYNKRSIHFDFFY